MKKSSKNKNVTIFKLEGEDLSGKNDQIPWYMHVQYSEQLFRQCILEEQGLRKRRNRFP